MANIPNGISSVYRDENARIAPGHLARASVRMFNTLVAAYEDPIEREIGIKVLLQQLRIELRAPVSGASSKG